MNTNKTQYHKNVDALLQKHCGISIDDTSPEFVDSCHANNESERDCFMQLAKKYDLILF